MQQDGDDVQAGEERQQHNGFEDDLQSSHANALASALAAIISS